MLSAHFPPQSTNNIYDPAGLALKYGVDGDVVGELESDLGASDSSSSNNSSNCSGESTSFHCLLFSYRLLLLMQVSCCFHPCRRHVTIFGPHGGVRFLFRIAQFCMIIATDIRQPLGLCLRAEDSPVTRATHATDDDTTAHFSGGMTPILQELQNRNATLLEAVEEKNRQIKQLGTLVEALEPVPGLDPDAFVSVLRGGSGATRGEDLDYRDVKIVHLAKRTRALNARLEGEKAR